MSNDQALTPAQAADVLESAANPLVEASLIQFYAIHPDLREAHGPQGVRRCREDCHYHVSFLASALRNDAPDSFVDYMRWVQNVLRNHNRASEGLLRMIEIIGQHIRHRLSNDVWRHAQPVLDAALHALQEDAPIASSISGLSTPGSPLMQQYLGAVLAGNRLQAQSLVLTAFREGLTIRDVYLDVFQPALYELGLLWEKGQVSVAQEHLATAITQTILSALYAEVPMNFYRDESALVACLSGNYHQIGPRMVADLLALEGFDTRFLGANTPENSLLEMIEETRPQVVGLPSTMNWHVDAIRQTIDHIRADFHTYRPTIMVGGLAFNLIDGLWQRVGGDVWGPDAGQAIDNLLGSAS